MASTERDSFEAKAAAVLNDPAYEKGLRDEQEAKAREIRRAHGARLRRLASVAVAAMKGDHGPDAQATVTAALQAFGDVRADVDALARWDFAHRMLEPPLELDKPLIRRALASKAVESSLRSVEALAREPRTKKGGT